MSQRIQVLLVEDSPADAELLLRALRQGGFAPDCVRVETETGFLERLHGGLDLVLSDYNLPRFSGLRALELLKQQGLEVPFILVSGTIGEETAVQAMKWGASDYFLKDRLGRLGPAVTQAMAQARLRRERIAAEQALRASEQRFRTTLENLMEGCQIIGRDWRYLYVNEIAARHVHSTVEQVVGRAMSDVYPGLEATPLFAILQRSMAEGKPERMEHEFVQEDGAVTWFQLVIQPVPEGLFILTLDITPRKRAEEKIQGQLAELQRWHDATLGREERVLALKQEVNELLVAAGAPARYQGGLT